MLTLQSQIHRSLLSLACLSACAFSLICARADNLSRKNTPESTAAAAHLLPSNALYLRQLAQWHPASKVELLTRVVALNRFDSDAWIQLGLDAELHQKNPALAERYFLTAAQVNHMYLPRWTLANFYFRQQNSAQLFEWARQTLLITPNDSTPAFVSLWLADPNPARIAAAIPPREQVLLQYAAFLAQTNRFDLAQRALNRAISLSPSHPPLSEFNRVTLDTHADVILDRLLQSQRVPAAIQLWGRLAAAKWIPAFSVPSVSRPLTNGDFKVPFWSHGFDWQVQPASGVAVDQFPDLSNIRFTFSGTQPEACPLLQQWLPLEKGRHYRLTWAADLDQIARESGLTWNIYTVTNGTPVPTGLASPHLTATTDSAAAWDFQAPGSSDLFLLVLQYARPLGEVRIEGSLSLRNIALHSI